MAGYFLRRGFPLSNVGLCHVFKQLSPHTSWVRCCSSQVIIAQKGPYQVSLEAGKRYSWCCCGHSKKQPFCDGSHKGTGIKPIRFIAQETTDEAFLCGCKQTGSPPFCDGTHAMDAVQSA